MQKNSGKQLVYKYKCQHWGGNRQLSMEETAVEYFTNSVDPGRNEAKSGFHTYISDNNEQDAYDSQYHIIHLFKKNIESGLLVSGMSKVWDDTNWRAKKYRCSLTIYLITVL